MVQDHVKNRGELYRGWGLYIYVHDPRRVRNGLGLASKAPFREFLAYFSAFCQLTVSQCFAPSRMKLRFQRENRERTSELPNNDTPNLRLAWLPPLNGVTPNRFCWHFNTTCWGKQTATAKPFGGAVYAGRSLRSQLVDFLRLPRFRLNHYSTS